MLLQAAYTLSIFNNILLLSPLQFLYCLSLTSMPQTVLSQFQCRPNIYLCDITSGVASRYVGLLWINFFSAFPAVSSQHSQTIQIVYVIIINQPLKFIIIIVIITSLLITVLTQQHNHQLQNNAYGEKGKKETRATNKQTSLSSQCIKHALLKIRE